MKKYALLICLSLLCSYITATETPRLNVRLNYPRTMKSNETRAFQVNIQNIHEETLYDLELSVLEVENLEINLDRIRINSLERNESIVVNMEVINNHSTFFDRDHVIVLRVSGENFTRDSNLSITIEPVEFFWFIVIFSFMTIFAAILILIFLKLNREEI